MKCTTLNHHHPTPPPSLGFSWFREVGFLKCLLTRSFSLEKKSFYMLLYWIKNLFLAHQNVSRDHKFNKLESTIHVRNIIIYSCIVLNFFTDFHNVYICKLIELWILLLQTRSIVYESGGGGQFCFNYPLVICNFTMQACILIIKIKKKNCHIFYQLLISSKPDPIHILIIVNILWWCTWCLHVCPCVCSQGHCWKK